MVWGCAAGLAVPQVGLGPRSPAGQPALLQDTGSPSWPPEGLGSWNSRSQRDGSVRTQPTAGRPWWAVLDTLPLQLIFVNHFQTCQRETEAQWRLWLASGYVKLNQTHELTLFLRLWAENGSSLEAGKKKAIMCAHGWKPCIHKSIYLISEHKALLLYTQLSEGWVGRVRGSDFQMRLLPRTELGSKQVCLNNKLLKNTMTRFGKTEISNSTFCLYST